MFELYAKASGSCVPALFADCPSMQQKLDEKEQWPNNVEICLRPILLALLKAACYGAAKLSLLPTIMSWRLAGKGC